MSKHILITGSTDGIGKILALELANEGHHVYIHGRNQEKVKAVVNEIVNTSNNNNVKGFIADLSDLAAVKDMADQINKSIPQLDALVNNAGIFKSSASTKSGYELRFTVNYLAPYLLTKEVMPLLKKADHARIVNLSSAAQAPVAIDAAKGTRAISVNEAYAQSKLALTMWSFYLANKQDDISVIAVNPGSLLNTKMANEAYGQHWSPAEKGSDILYDLTLGKQYQGLTGKYYDNDNGEFARAHADAYNQDAINELIEETEQMILL
ncbi:SDR family NAD(P)-dependent oxidoreductase [Saccharicrinis aurantiacus]|uniref:SDR family NAD(P)-dependent oxidoreductase n=1 Tax=Saccharicrinis aurantiacus TaxID=1849719 RepID=UPI000837D7C5|nr:SDR family NAD(P)-dependent oxidoreductase [Saccharicrinis aurantiacus]